MIVVRGGSDNWLTGKRGHPSRKSGSGCPHFLF